MAKNDQVSRPKLNQSQTSQQAKKQHYINEKSNKDDSSNKPRASIKIEELKNRPIDKPEITSPLPQRSLEIQDKKQFQNTDPKRKQLLQKVNQPRINQLDYKQADQALKQRVSVQGNQKPNNTKLAKFCAQKSYQNTQKYVSKPSSGSSKRQSSGNRLNKTQDISDYTSNKEADEAKTQLHQLRLKNAEQRSEIAKVRKENEMNLDVMSQQLELIQRLDKEKYAVRYLITVQSSQYIAKQDMEIESLVSQNKQQHALLKVQNEQVTNLKSVLENTINVKIKYENIIKKLIETPQIKEIVLSTINEVQTGQVPPLMSYVQSRRSQSTLSGATSQGQTQSLVSYQKRAENRPANNSLVMHPSQYQYLVDAAQNNSEESVESPDNELYITADEAGSSPDKPKSMVRIVQRDKNEISLIEQLRNQMKNEQILVDEESGNIARGDSHDES